MASAPDVSSPHFQVRTCNLCRQRRVKCDRRPPRCSNCVRSEADCVYPPGRGRAPKRPKRDVAPLVSERLSRLESIIHQLSAAGAGHSLSAEETSRIQDTQAQGPSGDSTQPLGQDFSRLKVSDSKSYYVNNPLWVTLSDEVEELRDLLFEPASDDAGYEPTQPSGITVDAIPFHSQLGLNAAIFGYRATISSLQPFHPSLAQAVTLFAAFTDNVAPLIRIFHMPTLTRIYWDAVASLGSLDKHIETLLFTIHYSALISLSPDQCLDILGEAREVCLERYRFAVEQALARGNLLNTQSMTMLQAVVLFLSALPNEDNSRATWSLTSLVYHIARTMGLHRDGAAFGLKPFETELRRRLWWQICILDSRSSEYHCNEPIARGFVSDTKPPLHIDDADLSSDMTEAPAERWDRATDMTLTLVRCEAIQTSWKLGLIKENWKQPGGSASNGAPTAADGNNRDPKTPKNYGPELLIQKLEARLRDKHLPICDPSVPFQLLSSSVARIILARFRLITKYSAASHGAMGGGLQGNRGRGGIPSAASNNASQLEHNLRNELFHISSEILEVSGTLLTNPVITQWTWYSKTHIQWGAMAFVLSELCARPHSPECDRAWDSVTTVYDGWRVGRSNQDDEGRLALWRPIKRLMAKARYVRELQKTDIKRPIQATDKKAWRPDSAAPGAAAEFLTHYPPSDHTVSPWGDRPTPETSLSGTSSTPYGPDGSDALQRVLGTEPLGLFMDLLPDWPWADDDATALLAATSKEGLDYVL